MNGTYFENSKPLKIDKIEFRHSFMLNVAEYYKTF